MGNNTISNFLPETASPLHTVELTIGGTIIVDFSQIASYIQSRDKDSGELDGLLDGVSAPFLEEINNTRVELHNHIVRLRGDIAIYSPKPLQKGAYSNLNRCEKDLNRLSDGDILAGYIPKDINIKLGNYWQEYLFSIAPMSRSLRRKEPKQQNALLVPPRAVFMKDWLSTYDRDIARLKAKKEQEKHQKLHPGIKKNKTKNSRSQPSSVIDNIDVSQQVARPIEEKLGRIQIRVDNILGKTITQQSLDELQMIGVNIEQLKIAPDTPLGNIAQNISELIAEVLGAGIQDELDILPAVGDIVPDHGNSIGEANTLIQNNEFIMYIRAVRSTIIRYNLSSKQGGKSIGDGNFIAHVWRPFLSMVEHLLQANRIDANSFAWQDISQEIQSSHDGFTKRVRLKMFMDILSTISDVSDWQSNWENIVQSVQQFAQTASYTRSNGVTPLNNFLGVLIENPPPSR